MKPILIIEDDEDIRTILVEFLGSLGLAVESADDGHEALRLLKREAPPPRLIFLDIMMPGMDGLTFLREFAKVSPPGEIPVVAMTADANLLTLALKAGAQSGLRKPMDLDDLMGILSRFGILEDGDGRHKRTERNP